MSKKDMTLDQFIGEVRKLFPEWEKADPGRFDAYFRKGAEGYDYCAGYYAKAKEVPDYATPDKWMEGRIADAGNFVLYNYE